MLIDSPNFSCEEYKILIEMNEEIFVPPQMDLLCAGEQGHYWWAGGEDCFIDTYNAEIFSYKPRNNPVNTKHLYNIYTMLDQRRRRWADVV